MPLPSRVTDLTSFGLLLSVAEEWKVSKESLYVQHSEEFRRAVKQVDKMSRIFTCT